MTKYGTIVSEKSIALTFSNTKAYGTKFYLAIKQVKVNPGGIIWTDFVVLKYPTVHTNFQGHPPLGSKEEDS